MFLVGRPHSCWLVATVALIGGCARADRPAETRHDESASQPADSLALSGDSGLTVWYTLSRTGTGGDGSPCVERGLEIRRGARRIPVPLLYTASPPTLLNDSTMRAVLWTNCRPGDPYRVNLRTGRPVRERIKGNS